MIKFRKCAAKRFFAIILVFFCIAAVFSGCKSKEYNTKDDYKNIITEFADKYGFEILDEKEPWTDTYEISLSNGTEIYEFSFKLGTEKQMNSFEIWCENPVSFDAFLEITNEFSKKKFSEAFYYNVINNENPFYNNDDEEHAYYKDKYDFYKSDYLGFIEAEYCIAYCSYTGYGTLLSVFGFTK